VKLRNPRLVLLPAALATLAVATLPAMAVSSGGYDSAKQGCSKSADDSYHPKYTEKGCDAATLQISDATHRYVLVGVPQTPDGTTANAVVVCIDLTGTAKCARVDHSGFTPLPDEKGTPVNPQSAELHAYFGADDNLDSGEHDGSEQIENGPSDGGSIVANVAPLTAAQWLSQVTYGDQGYLLTHPLPIGDGGFGACADGLCFSVQTQQRVAYQAGGRHSKSRDVSNYDGHTWDPQACAGPSDTNKDCGGKSMKWWHDHNQTSYVEPGIQIYEDPDPQGSPEGPYPLPSLYIGTCGFVAGGGTAPAFPASPITNKSGQLVVSTGC
jgi:hypothetical protein